MGSQLLLVAGQVMHDLEVIGRQRMDHLLQIAGGRRAFPLPALGLYHRRVCPRLVRRFGRGQGRCRMAVDLFQRSAGRGHHFTCHRVDFAGSGQTCLHLADDGRGVRLGLSRPIDFGCSLGHVQLETSAKRHEAR